MISSRLLRSPARSFITAHVARCRRGSTRVRRNSRDVDQNVRQADSYAVLPKMKPDVIFEERSLDGKRCRSDEQWPSRSDSAVARHSCERPTWGGIDRRSPSRRSSEKKNMKRSSRNDRSRVSAVGPVGGRARVARGVMAVHQERHRRRAFCAPPMRATHRGARMSRRSSEKKNMKRSSRSDRSRVSAVGPVGGRARCCAMATAVHQERHRRCAFCLLFVRAHRVGRHPPRTARRYASSIPSTGCGMAVHHERHRRRASCSRFVSDPRGRHPPRSRSTVRVVDRVDGVHQERHPVAYSSRGSWRHPPRPHDGKRCRSCRPDALWPSIRSDIAAYD